MSDFLVTLQGEGIDRIPNLNLPKVVVWDGHRHPMTNVGGLELEWKTKRSRWRRWFFIPQRKATITGVRISAPGWSDTSALVGGPVEFVAGDLFRIPVGDLDLTLR